MAASINVLNLLASLKWEESEDLEFKSAKGGLPKNLWETYSAMANSSGGIILLGVENNGSISGINDISGIKKDFWNTINNRGKVSFNLLSSTDIAEITYQGKIILAIRVPKASRYDRPIFLNQNPLTGTYRRNHEGDYHCTEREVSRMLSDRSEEPADSRILENFTLSDIDATSLQQYRQRFTSYKPTHPWLSENDEKLLTKLGGWRQDRNTGQEGLTVAGILMFGREEAIREAIPGYHLDYREKLSVNPHIRWTDRLTIDGTWNANLFQFYLRVIQRLSADLKLPFQLKDDLLRKSETEIHEAIREALVNALIHADYQGNGGVVIEKYPDRFILSNPGTLLISLDQLLRGNISECRNKSLQNMFMLFGAAEKLGSGVDKIRKGWASQHWRSPSVAEQFRPDRIYWHLPMISLIPDESLKRLQDLFGSKYQDFNSLEIQALVTADIEKYVDNARMREITGNHPTDITRILQGLASKGALIQEGQARGSRYRLFDSVHKSDDSVHKSNDSVHKGDDSVHKGDDSVHKSDDSVHNWGVDTDKRANLEEIALPARENRRLPPENMEFLIQEICRGQWLSRTQIADILQRNPDGLRSRFLTPMVAHGRLRLRYPDRPNRSDQAYTSTQEQELEIS